MAWGKNWPKKKWYLELHVYLFVYRLDRCPTQFTNSKAFVNIPLLLIKPKGLPQVWFQIRWCTEKNTCCIVLFLIRMFFARSQLWTAVPCTRDAETRYPAYTNTHTDPPTSLNSIIRSVWKMNEMSWQCRVGIRLKLHSTRFRTFKSVDRHFKLIQGPTYTYM